MENAEKKTHMEATWSNTEPSKPSRLEVKWAQ